MTLALDSSVVIDIERRHQITIQRLEQLKEQYVGISSLPFMSYVELLYGSLERSDKNAGELVAFLEKFHFLVPRKSCARTLAKIKKRCDEEGRPIPLSDLFIAAQVMDEGLVLVTKDKIFSQIKELEAVIID